MGVDVVSLREERTEERPRQPDLGLQPQTELEAAIERSQDYLLSQQKPEGYWIGELMVDATLVADMVAYHHWNGKVDPQWQRKAVNHIFSMQLPDGGWNIYYGGPAEVNATIKCYLALKLAGVPVTDPRMLRAREVALNLGGVPRMNTFSKLYLALLGLFPWEYVPTIPCEVILIGKWFYVNFNEMSSWSRSMLVPLAIINHFKPTRAAQEEHQPQRAVPGRHPRARPGAGARPGTDHLAQLLPLARPRAQVRGVVCAEQDSSVPQAGPAQGRTMDAGAV